MEDYNTNRRSSLSMTSKMAPRKPPRRSTVSLFSLAQENPPKAQRRALVRTPSQLYRYVQPDQNSSSTKKFQIEGPEFIVRSKDEPCTINLCDQTKKVDISRKVTVILLNGQQIKVICNPCRTSVNYILKAITQNQHYYSFIHLLGLAILIKGEFHFLPPKLKLAKFAPKAWKESKSSKEAFSLHDFTLYVQFLAYPDIEHFSTLDDDMVNLVYLQLRHDFLEGRVLLPRSLMMSLAALSLQAEFGSICSKDNNYFLLDHFLPQSFIENNVDSTEELSDHLCKLHKYLHMTPLTAKLTFISRLRDSIAYGMRFYHCYVSKSEKKIWLAVSFKGIHILDKTPSWESLKSALFVPWTDLEKCSHTSLKVNISHKSNNKLFKHQLIFFERSLYILHLIEMHKYFHKKRVELLKLNPTKKSSLSLANSPYSYALLQTIEESSDSKSKGNGIPNGLGSSNRSHKATNESVETQEICSKDDIHQLSSNFTEICLLSNETNLLTKEKRTSFSTPDLNLSSQVNGDCNPTLQDAQTDDLSTLESLQDDNFNRKDSSSLDLSEILSTCSETEVFKSPVRSYSEYKKQKKPPDDMLQLSESVPANQLDETDLGTCDGSKVLSAGSPFQSYQRDIRVQEMKTQELHSCRSTPSPDSVLSCHSVLNCSNSNESLAQKSPYGSPKKSFSGVKMGTRVTSARLQKHKFRLFEAPSEAANKSDLNTSMSIAVLEPSESENCVQENSASESLLTRFLGGSEDTLERRLVSATLTKENGSLGLLLAQGNDEALYIMGISPGGPAAREGTLCSGDRLVGIDGLSVENMTYNRAVSLLKVPSEQVTLLVSQSVQETTAPDTDSKGNEAPIMAATSEKVPKPSIDPSHVTVITIGSNKPKKGEQTTISKQNTP